MHCHRSRLLFFFYLQTIDEWCTFSGLGMMYKNRKVGKRDIIEDKIINKKFSWPLNVINFSSHIFDFIYCAAVCGLSGKKKQKTKTKSQCIIECKANGLTYFEYLSNKLLWIQRRLNDTIKNENLETEKETKTTHCS